MTFADDPAQTREGGMAYKTLCRFGIRVIAIETESMEKGIYFSTTSTKMAEMLRGTPWHSNWTRPLISLGAKKLEKPMRFAGILSRAIYFTSK